jgi:anti-sigma factor RsiW
MDMTTPVSECKPDEIAAYLDGELDTEQGLAFERHNKDCSRCAAELQDQRRFLCELDVALNLEPAPELPRNFVEVVAVNAQSDMRGVRTTVERARAFKLCALLALSSLVILGATARDVLGTFLRPVLSLGSILGGAAYGAGAGVAIISRSFGRHLLLGSSIFSLFLILLFAAALTLLPALISRYHRTQS